MSRRLDFHTPSLASGKGLVKMSAAINSESARNIPTPLAFSCSCNHAMLMRWVLPICAMLGFLPERQILQQASLSWNICSGTSPFGLCNSTSHKSNAGKPIVFNPWSTETISD